MKNVNENSIASLVMRFLLVSCVYGFASTTAVAQSVIINPSNSTFLQNSLTDSVVIRGKSSVPLTLQSDQSFIMLTPIT